MFEAGAANIFVILTIIIAILFSWNDRTVESWVAGAFVGAFIGAIITGVILLAAGDSRSSAITDADLESGECSIYYEDIPLISIEREKTLSGSFFIGSGSIRSSIYYFAYVETKDGLFLNKYPRYKSYIVEYDGDPKAVTTNYSCSRPFFAWLRGVEEAPRNYEDRKYQLYVPKGTIIRDFTL